VDDSETQRTRQTLDARFSPRQPFKYGTYQTQQLPALPPSYDTSRNHRSHWHQAPGHQHHIQTQNPRFEERKCLPPTMADPTQPRQNSMDTMDQNLAKTVHQTRNGYSTEELPRPMAITGSSILKMAHHLQPARSDHHNNDSQTTDSQLPQVQQHKVPSVLSESTSSAAGDPHQLPSNNRATTTRFSSSSTNLPNTKSSNQIPRYPLPQPDNKYSQNPTNICSRIMEHIVSNPPK